MFLFYSESKKQFREDRKSQKLLKNLTRISGTKEEEVAHPDTLDNYLNQCPSEHVEKIIEESIATVKHLKVIQSYSREGVSMVIAEFDWGTNMNFASLNLREKIDLVKERLPREAEEPLVLRYNPFAKPILIYSMVAKGNPKNPKTYSLSDIFTIAKTRLKDKCTSNQISGYILYNVSTLSYH